MLQICDMGQEGRHAEDFFAQKIRQLQPGANPQTWVPEASMLTTRPLKLLTAYKLRKKFRTLIITILQFRTFEQTEDY
jgi:hypothetical protein